MKIATLFSNAGRYLWSLVPRDVRINAAKKRCEQQCGDNKPSVLEFPWDTASVRSIVIMLPDSPGEALYQAETCAAFPQLFPNAALTFFCTNAVASWFQLLHPRAVFIEYNTALPTFFSGKLDVWGNELRDDAFDVCLLLNENADAEQLYLAGRTAARIRAGYGSTDDGVLLNLHVSPSQEHTGCADRNFAMARIFGAKSKPQVQWNLSSNAMSEVSRMMPECTSDKKNVVGIDIGSLFVLCGQEWCNRLCRALTSNPLLCCYLYCSQSPGTSLLRFTEEFRCRFFQKLDIQRTCALIAQSRCFVTADRALLCAGSHIGDTIVGLLAEKDVSRYGINSATAHCIPWKIKPSDAPVDTVIQAVQSAAGKAGNA